MISQFVSKQWKHWLPIVLGCGILGMAVLFYLFRGEVTNAMEQAEQLKAWILGFGSLAPIVYVALYVAQIICPPLPGGVIGTLGGYLFGTELGLLLNYTGILIGATSALLLARRVGRPLVQRFASKQELTFVSRLISIKSTFVWLLIFMSPLGDVTYFLAGLTKAPLRRLLVAALIGRSPSLIISTLSGAGIASVPPQFVFIPISILFVLAMVGYLMKDRLINFALQYAKVDESS